MSNIICPPETKCKDCDITDCSRNINHPYITARQDGKSKLTLAKYINNCAEISQDAKIELLQMLNKI